MNKPLLFFLSILFVNTLCFAQSNYTESLTITTYYPAPYGVYRNLKLNPSNEPSASAGLSRGVIYFDNAMDTLRVYNNSGWVNMTAGDNKQPGDLQALGGTNPSCPAGSEALLRCATGGNCYDVDNPSVTTWNKVFCGTLAGADGSALLIGRYHTVLECSNARGTPVKIPGGTICKFTGAVCYSGWRPYSSWMTVPAQSKTLSGSCEVRTACQLTSGYRPATWSCSCTANILASPWSDSQGSTGSCSCTASGTCYLRPSSCPVGPLSTLGTPNEVGCQ